MFIAHLPAGYLLTRFVLKKTNYTTQRHTNYFYLLGALFSVLPDFDLFYFYFFNASQPHHVYAPHIPLYWPLISSVVFIVAYKIKSNDLKLTAMLLLGNTLLHMLLDTLAGGIMWLYPYTSEFIRFSYIPATHNLWVMNFIMHWTFIFEIIICLTAIVIFLHDHFKVTNHHSHRND